MKEITLKIDQMKHLEELGLDTGDASMYWFVDEDFIQLMLINQNDILDKISNYKRIPAYTLQDILEKLPVTLPTTDKRCKLDKVPYFIGPRITEAPSIIYENPYFRYSRVICINGANFLDTAYKTLVWCIENGYINTNKL